MQSFTILLAKICVLQVAPEPYPDTAVFTARGGTGFRKHSSLKPWGTTPGAPGLSAATGYQERGQFRQGAGESLGHPNARVRPVLTRTCSVAQSCPTLWDPMDCSLPGSSVHGDFPGKNSGVGCHALLQGIFPTQGLNPGLPHCRQILYHLSHQGNPLTRILTPCSQVPSLQKGGHQSHSRTSSPSCNCRHRRGNTPLTESDQTQTAEAILEVVCALSEDPGLGAHSPWPCSSRAQRPREGSWYLWLPTSGYPDPLSRQGSCLEPQPCSHDQSQPQHQVQLCPEPLGPLPLPICQRTLLYPSVSSNMTSSHKASSLERRVQ